jgi:tetratricopeptide (TPR) repeat protein
MVQFSAMNERKAQPGSALRPDIHEKEVRVMQLRSNCLPLLFLLVVLQSPQTLLREHYEAAEARARAGNLAAAETEYKAILAIGYDRLGKIYLAQQSYKSAVAAFEAAARYDQGSQDALIDLAIAYFNAGQFKQALAPLGKALAANPQSVAAHHMMGKTYFMLGDFAKSAGELKAALKLKADDYDVAYTLGLAHLKQRQFAAARQVYDQMLKQLGDRPQLHILFGRAYRETDFLAEAIEEFKKTLALDPHFTRVHYYLGLTYLLKDGSAKLDEAAAEFKIELAAHPDEFFANYYLGVICAMQRKWEPAIPLLEKAAQLQPKNPDPYFQLGQAYQSTGKHEAAIEALKKSIALTPSPDHNDHQVAAAHYQLAQSLLRTGRTEEGEKEMQTAAELKTEGYKHDEAVATNYLNSAYLQASDSKLPKTVSAEGIIEDANAPDEKVAAELKSNEAYYVKVVASGHSNVGLLRAQQQDFRTAAEQFALAAGLNPQLQDVYFNWGLACYKAELYNQAIAPLESELKANANHLAAKQLLGMSYFMADNFARAAELLTEVITIKKNDPGLYYTLAVSLIKQGKQEQANRIIQQMVAAAAGSPQLHILLGQAYYEQGSTDKSLEELKAALATNSRTPLAHYYTGMIYLKLGRFDDAAREFESELALSPNDIQTKFHRAFALLAAQKLEQGVRLMREVAQSKPDYGEAHYELGKALLQQGDVKGAIASLELAVKLKPDEFYVHYQLGRAYLAVGRQADGEREVEISKQLKEKARSQSSQ